MTPLLQGSTNFLKNGSIFSRRRRSGPHVGHEGHMGLWSLAFFVVLSMFVTLFTGVKTVSAGDVYENNESIGCTNNEDCSDIGEASVNASVGAILPNQKCMQQIYSLYGQGGGLVCTANDIQLATVSNVTIIDPCLYPGDTAVISLTAGFVLTAQARYDLGVYIAQDGGNALTGTCAISTFPYIPNPPYLDLDGTTNTGTFCGGTPSGQPCTTTSQCPTGQTCSTVGPGIQDLCGDIDSTHTPLSLALENITVQCIDNNGDGNLDLNACMSWRQSGANELCVTPLNAFPGAPSKCNCQPVPGVPVPVPGQIVVQKATLDTNGNPFLDNTTQFGFSITGPDSKLPDNFTIVGTSPPNLTHTSPGLYAPAPPAPPAAYSVTETGIPSGWALVPGSCNCVSNQGKPNQNPATGNVSIHPGETLTCTFTNMVVPNPKLTLKKSSTTTQVTAAGQIVLYGYLITNAGNQTLTGITVTDSLGITVNCTVTTLNPGESTTCRASYTVTQADINAGGNLTNTATATSTQTAPVTDQLQIPIIQNPKLSLTKSSTTTQVTAAGQVVNYNYAVTNTGNIPLTGITVTDSLGITVSCLKTTLNPAESTTCTASYTVTQANMNAGGNLTNTATAASNQTAPVTAQLQIPIVQNPKLSIKKSSTTTQITTAGQLVNYNYLVTNSGNVILTGITVIDSLGITVNCVKTTLNPGESTTCTASYTVTQADINAGGYLTNIGTADSDQTAPVTNQLEIPINQNPQLSIQKSSTTAEVTTAGQVVNYNYLVTNQGNTPLTNITVTDSLLITVSCIKTTLNPGESTTCTASYTVKQSDIDAGGNLTNTATADSDQTNPVSVVLEIPIVKNPTLSIVKSSTTTQITAVGQVVNYNYLLTNQGNITLTGITVSDSLGITVSCIKTTLTPGESTTCTASYTVKQSDINTGGNLTNTATATSDHTGPVYAQLQIPIVKNPQLSLKKSANATQVTAAGEIIFYNYLVTNQGNVTLTGIAVSDSLGITVNCSITTLNPGESTTCKSSYTVKQSDINAGGSLNNIATAGSDQTAPVTDQLQIPIVQNPQLSLKKSSTTAQVTTAGQIVDYQYLLTNGGNVTLTGTTVSDSLGITVSCVKTTLNPGESTTCTASYTVKQSDIDAGGNLTDTATADSDQTAPVTDQLQIPIVPNPTLSIVKSSTTTQITVAGQVVNYDYLVTNGGTVTLTGITVTDTLGITVSCVKTTLAPGESTTCTASYTVTQANIDAGGNLTNTAAAYSDQTDHVHANLSIPIVQNPAISLKKSSTTTQVTTVGQVVNYEYLVKNEGNVTLTGVTVCDCRLIPVSCSMTTLNPGESMTCTASYTVTQADINAGGYLTNQSRADSDQTEAVTDILQIPIVNNPGLSIVKSSTTTQVTAAGQLVNYNYLVANSGNVSLTGITVSDSLGITVGCLQTTLNPGESTTCTASYTVKQSDINAGGNLTNTATADSDQTAPVTTQLQIPIIQNPQLSLNKSAGITQVTAAGEIVFYNYLVKNEGNVILTGITVSDSMGITVNCSQTTLNPGESMTCRASYTVKQSDMNAGGSLTNTATADSDQTGPVTDQLQIPIVQNPQISLQKSSTTADVTTAGQVVDYQYLVKNSGNVTLTGITVSDSLGITVSCVKTTLNPGESTTCTASYTVTQADIDAGGYLINTATADSDQTPPVTDQLQIPIVPNPTLSIVKSSATTQVTAAGQVVIYNYLVTNGGNATLTGVTVSDSLGITVSCVKTTLAPGESTTCTATYTVTQANIDAGGNLTNTAAADSDQTNPVHAKLSIPIVQNPAISLVKSSTITQVTAAGQVVNYNYLVTNEGNVTLTGVTVCDCRLIPVSCGMTTLIPGESMICTSSYTVTQADINAGGYLTNQSRADSDQTEAVIAQLQIPIIQNSQLSINKSSTTTQVTAAGQVVNYTYLLINEGTETLTGITVSDSLLIPVSCLKTTLNPGESTTCTASYTVTQADIDAGGNLTNTAAADSDQIGPVTTQLQIPINQSPKLSVNKSSATTQVTAAGQVVNYNYLITNQGNVILTGITVSDSLLIPVSCVKTTLNPGESTTCTASYTVTQADIDAGGYLTDTATASSNQTGSVTSQLQIPIIPNPTLSMVKSSTTTQVTAAGQVVNYDYLLKNEGNEILTGITVSDSLLIPVTCVKTTLNPGESTTCTASYTVTQADIDAGGVLSNTATADSDQTVPVHARVEIPIIQNPTISIKKSSTTTQVTAAGQVINYEYLVTNEGNVTLTGVTVCDCRLIPVSCGMTTLSPGQSMICTSSYTVTQADMNAGGYLSNKSKVDSDQTGPVIDEMQIPIVQNLKLTIKKSSTTAQVTAAGQIVNYSYLVTNEGNVALTNITVSDSLLIPVMCEKTTLCPGTSMTCMASYTVTQADIDAGMYLTNIATAVSDQTGAVTDQLDIPIIQDPKLTINKNPATQSVNIGADAEFFITVKNTGNVTLTDVTMSDPLAPDCEKTFPSLAPYAVETYTCTVPNVTQGFTNVSTATGITPGGSTVTATGTAVVKLTAGIAVKKYFSVDCKRTWIEASEPPGPTVKAKCYKLAYFKYKVTNIGGVPLYDVTLVDTDYNLSRCDLKDTLEPGESSECIIGPKRIDVGQHTNTATATGKYQEVTISDTDSANYVGKRCCWRWCSSDTNPSPFQGVLGNRNREPRQGVLGNRNQEPRQGVLGNRDREPGQIGWQGYTEQPF